MRTHMPGLLGLARMLMPLVCVQAAIVFMASDASAFMTGHNLAITGGHTLW